MNYEFHSDIQKLQNTAESRTIKSIDKKFYICEFGKRLRFGTDRWRLKIIAPDETIYQLYTAFINPHKVLVYRIIMENKGGEYKELYALPKPIKFVSYEFFYEISGEV